MRVHVHRGLFDIITSTQTKPAWTIDEALHAITSAGQGVLVLLAYNERTNELISRLGRLDQSADGGLEQPAPAENTLRMLGAGGQILADQGVTNMVALGREKKAFGISGFGLEIEEYIPDIEQFRDWQKK